MTPNMILQECLFGFEGIEDETKSKIEEEIIEISSDEENDEENASSKVKKEKGGMKRTTEEKVLEISSDEENDEENASFKVKGRMKRTTEEQVLEISSENENDERVVRVKEEGSIGSLTVPVNHLMIGQDREEDKIILPQGLETRSVSGNNPVRDDSKAVLKDKVMEKSPRDPKVVLPFGWEKMKKEDLIYEFLKLNQGKDVPQYLLENLREADYEDNNNKIRKDPKVKKENLREENDVKIKDQKEIKKETKVKKELKRKEIQKNKNMKKMEVEVRLYLTHCILYASVYSK